ncbi:Short-chain dehydrogenase [Streptoalloteichus hindustanus]|uniref:Short-chain dehydrogenase n=1 Tax=Streptoalloteichus hindustanus TaxID=2017 RepID=A0A1M5G8D2_STRHI|nr:Short-chain dehydrogenase [Streptoalloteichus hindustanus]
MRLVVREEGDPTGPTVLLVHGFPDSSRMWDGVAERLRERFRVVRFDVRGAGRSGRPKGREGYRLDQLAADVVSVIRAVSPHDPVHLVGHDWGSIQSWEAVTEPGYAHLFASYTSISGPCLDHLGHWLRERLRRPGAWRDVLRQGLRSWYVYALHLPVVPELALRHAIGPAWAKALRRRGVTGAESLPRDAANGVELYRANIRARLGEPRQRTTKVPVQLLVPTRDPYVDPRSVDDTHRWCDRLWRRDIPTGHWAPRTDPGLVARAIAEFVDHLSGEAAPRELARARVDGPRRRFEGQLMLITGAGSGIGRATALAAAEAGADVVVWDIDGPAAERTAEQVREHGVRAWAKRVDVSDAEAVREAAATVCAEQGVPDVVMANAGVGMTGPFAATSEADWRRTVNVNLLGSVWTLNAFVPELLARGRGGHLVITSSAAALAPSSGLPAYSATKAALLALGRSLRDEVVGQGIDVSVVCPGFIDTGFIQGMSFTGESEAERERARSVVEERMGPWGRPPALVARAVLRAVERRRFLVLVTPESRVMYAFSRIAPETLSWVMRVFGQRYMP